MTDEPITEERVEELGSMFEERRGALDEAMKTVANEVAAGETGEQDAFIRICEMLDLPLVGPTYRERSDSPLSECSLCLVLTTHAAEHSKWHHRLQAASQVQSYRSTMSSLGVDLLGSILRLAMQETTEGDAR